MRFSLVLAHPEPAPVRSRRSHRPDAGRLRAYGRALEVVGVLIVAEVLVPTSSATTITLRNGSLEVQDGTFAETKDALAGIFFIDVPDLDAAMGWRRSARSAVRPRRGPGGATSFVDGAWNDGCRLT